MLKVGYLTITPEAGELKGPSVYKLAPDTIEVIEVHHEVRHEYDSRHGTVSGDRKHAEFIIVKAIDMTTPKLNGMCARGEMIKEATLQYFIQVGSAPDPVPFYKWTLKNAIVTHVKTISPRDLGSEYEEQTDLLEEVGFAYQQITWEHAAHRAPIGLKDLPVVIDQDAWSSV